MKKLTVLLAVFLLAACGGKAEPEKTGNAEGTKDKDGNYATAQIVMEGDKVTSIKLDETKGDKTKKELGAAYNMKSASKIKKEWDEQVKFLEDYIVKKGVDAVKLTKDGYAENDDVKSGCTMNITSLMKVAQEAKANAK